MSAFMDSGPYCPECGTYLGDGYREGDLCLECWEQEHGEDSEGTNPQLSLNSIGKIYGYATRLVHQPGSNWDWD